jgi:hypothetical protein
MDIRLNYIEAERLRQLRKDVGCESPTAVVRALLEVSGEARDMLVKILKDPKGKFEATSTENGSKS